MEFINLKGAIACSLIFIWYNHIKELCFVILIIFRGFHVCGNTPFLLYTPTIPTSYSRIHLARTKFDQSSPFRSYDLSFSFSLPLCFSLRSSGEDHKGKQSLLWPKHILQYLILQEQTSLSASRKEKMGKLSSSTTKIYAMKKKPITN